MKERITGPLFKEGGSMRHALNVCPSRTSPIWAVAWGRFIWNGATYEVHTSPEGARIFSTQKMSEKRGYILTEAIENHRVEWVKTIWHCDPFELLRRVSMLTEFHQTTGRLFASPDVSRGYREALLDVRGMVVINGPSQKCDTPLPLMLNHLRSVGPCAAWEIGDYIASQYPMSPADAEQWAEAALQPLLSAGTVTREKNTYEIQP